MSSDAQFDVVGITSKLCFWFCLKLVNSDSEYSSTVNFYNML